MKLRPLLTLCAALLALSPGLATAQTSAVPNFISYQGRVVDTNGNNVGAGTPVNRTVIFRIWDSPSSTAHINLVYSEAQTVTVSDGEFSVLVGQGIANTTETFGYYEVPLKLPDLGTAFNGSARYLGVTVAATSTIATTDNEINPRQQIVATAFAMRAKFAESIGSSSDLSITPLTGTASNYGLGWYGTDRLFGGTAVDGPVLYGNAGGALGSNASGSQNTALRWDASGRIGIGTTSISSLTNKLTLQGNMATSPADQLTIRGASDGNKRLLLGYDTTANKASLQSYTGLSTTGHLLLNPSGGNVGVNNTNPSVALDVTGAIAASGDLTAATVSTGQIMTNSLEFSSPGNLGALFKAGSGAIPTNASAASGEMVLMGSPKLHLSTGNGGAAVMTLSGSNVGINNTAPSYDLEVGSATKLSDSYIRVSSGQTYGVTGILFSNKGWGYAISSNEEGGFGWAPGLHFHRGGTKMFLSTGGNVGIGTTSPTQAKLCVLGGPTFVSGSIYGAYFDKDRHAGPTFIAPRPMSIYASGGVRSDEIFVVTSDERIKTVLGRSDSSQDLKALLGIEVTDYRMKDIIGQGDAVRKKVIAQQVEKVFPLAVTQQTGVVPDIYQKASIKDGWVLLTTDLKKGERVKLITENAEGVHEVLEVREGAFRTNLQPGTEKVFVFGREVTDLRTVDYDTIAMLNVSATQELKREKDAEIQALRDENAALRRELAAKEASLEARLTALERRMSGEGATEVVSLRTAKVVE